ncbi:HAD-like domain-containing protein [Staphylotrichum tortipilum]|uniref:HAD-like domain-containing protein n=1 Tax=Staphylotrichum tortipilum TaxID=2831512 RepID=A0AAN6MQ82_9PEZI|nr:HAD-like domain-containing protein [Staphylotrichum longicolle]
MATPTPDLTRIRTLSFDCYGTLIDWESGLTSDLSPLLTRLPPSHPFNSLPASNPLLPVQHFNTHSEHLWATQPTLSYDANLRESLRALAADEGVTLPEGELEAIGDGPGRWPAFADTVDALRRLRRFYKIAILSNVNEANIARAVSGQLGGAVDAVYTAEAIGSYKPDHANFRYLFGKVKEEFGTDVDKGELLHVARSLTVDHVPAKELGLRSVWIARGGDKPEGYGTGGDLEVLTAEGKLGFEGVFQTLGEFAEEVERQFAEREKGK